MRKGGRSCGCAKRRLKFLRPSRRVGAGRAVSQELGSMVVKSLRQPRVAGSFQSPRVRRPSFALCRARSEHEIGACSLHVGKHWNCGRRHALAASCTLCRGHLLSLDAVLHDRHP